VAVIAEDPDLQRHPGLAQAVRDIVDAQRAEFLEKA
jgi:hypothetical protein